MVQKLLARSIQFGAVIALLGLISLAVPPAFAQGKAVEVLFVQAASGVTYKDGVLTLKDASPATAFFTDRPKRIVGHVKNAHFVKLWGEGKNSFKSDPPNAALSVFNSGGRPTQAVVVLSNPRIDGKNVLYDARTLRGTVPAQGGESTLFIDGADSPCYTDQDDPSYSGDDCWAQNAFSRGPGN